MTILGTIKLCANKRLVLKSIIHEIAILETNELWR